jgi:CheY-like chemotaxis protein
VRQAQYGTGRLQGQTLLLVDDERPILQAVAAMLSRVGCRTLLAATGRDALALCDRQPERLEAVILDLHLPGEDTAALFAAFRTRRPELPILLTSGLPEAAARERLGRGDVAGFLAKPFSLAQLVKTLEGALEPLPAPVDPPAPPPAIAERRDPSGVPGVPGEAPPAAEPFECWFPRRLAEAVRRGEVPEEMLRRLRAILQGGGDASADLPRLASVWEIADLAGIPPEQAVAVFEALQQLPGVAQEQLARRIAEAWLERQRSQNEAAEAGG